jgi:hypothetical protein
MICKFGDDSNIISAGQTYKTVIPRTMQIRDSSFISYYINSIPPDSFVLFDIRKNSQSIFDGFQDFSDPATLHRLPNVNDISTRINTGAGTQLWYGVSQIFQRGDLLTINIASSTGSPSLGAGVNILYSLI